MLSTGWF